MSKIHVLPDENLGDVLREYIEVDRKANIGEYIYFTDDTEIPNYLKVTGYNDEINYYKVEHNPDEWGATCEVSIKRSRTLEPTNIVHIDGKRYRLVNRKAKAGEKVIITETHPTLVYTKIGEIVKIIKTDGDTCGSMFKPHDIGEKGAVYHFQYQVLEPVEPINDIITAEENDSKSVIDLLANLTQRLVELEKRVVAIDEHNDVLIDHLNDVQEKLNQIKVPYFTTFKPNIYFNIHTKEKTAEEIAKEIIKTLNEMISKYNQ
jgi:hypothetical protein